MTAVPQEVCNPAQHSAEETAERHNTAHRPVYIAAWLLALVVFLDLGRSVARVVEVVEKRHSGNRYVVFRFRGLGIGLLGVARRVGRCSRGVGV